MKHQERGRKDGDPQYQHLREDSRALGQEEGMILTVYT